MKRFSLASGFVVFVVFVASIFNSLFVPQHVCEACGSALVQHEHGSSVWRCPRQGCGFVVDEEFIAPQPAQAQ